MLTPPDKERCQADVPGNGPFTLGGKIGNPKNGYRVRCENKPSVIVSERVPGPDGLRGSMSLCQGCHAELLKQHGPNYAPVTVALNEEEPAQPTIGIGAKLWRFDENRRRYTKPENPKDLWGKIIWREHWEPMFVVGETRVSWLVGYERQMGKREPHVSYKLPKAAFKNGECPRGWARSEEHLSELAWAREHCSKLSDAVLRCHEPRVLRAVWAALAERGLIK